MNQYKLTFTVTIEGLDDPVARRRAKDIGQAGFALAGWSEGLRL